MKTAILNRLNRIAEKQGIRILYACESGSRAWQFPSPDSDYDVRFIYAKPHNSYLSITEPRAQLSFPIVNDIDIYGWDIRKVLQLIRKSNTTPFEWLQSPEVYAQEDGFRDALWELCGQYFNQRSNIHHYLGIAFGALETVNDNDEITIKKLFYIIRPLLAAKWCFENNTIAPMTIEPLMTLLPESLRSQVQELIQLKSTVVEDYTFRMPDELRSYIDREIKSTLAAARFIRSRTFGAGPLDAFFQQTIRRHDYTGDKIE